MRILRFVFVVLLLHSKLLAQAPTVVQNCMSDVCGTFQPVPTRITIGIRQNISVVNTRAILHQIVWSSTPTPTGIGITISASTDGITYSTVTTSAVDAGYYNFVGAYRNIGFAVTSLTPGTSVVSASYSGSALVSAKASGAGVSTYCAFWTGAFTLSGDTGCTYASGVQTIYELRVKNSSDATEYLSVTHDESNTVAIKTNGNDSLIVGNTANGMVDLYNNNAARWRIGDSSTNYTLFGLASAVALNTTGTSGSAATMNGTIFWSGFSTTTGALAGAVCRAVTNEIEINTNAAGCLTSSERFKDRIQPMTHGWDWLKRMVPITWTWKDSGVHQPAMGPGTAEGMARIDPSLATYDDQGEPYGLNEAGILAVLVRTVQEQQAEIRELWRRIRSLE